MSTGNGTRVTLAVIKTEIEHLKKQQDEMKDGLIQIVKDHEERLKSAESEVSQAKGGVNTLKWFFGTALAVLSVVVTVLAAMK